MEQVSREMLMRMGKCLSCHRDAHEVVPAGSKITRDPPTASRATDEATSNEDCPVTKEPTRGLRAAWG